VTFVGGGYISFEFALIAARAATCATIVHRGTRPLARFDPDTIILFARAMRSGLTADQFKNMLWAYPTQASDTPYMV
jgi:pyruvate/2-oxoglutarate dehydrogenase complex dihydrolipoamide dehydrogenase (E3) component